MKGNATIITTTSTFVTVTTTNIYYYSRIQVGMKRITYTGLFQLPLPSTSLITPPLVGLAM